jgi:hypothetical protein
VICWTRFPSTDELLSQFFRLGGSAFEDVRSALPYHCRVAAGLGTFPHEAAFKLGNPSEATEDAAVVLKCIFCSVTTNTQVAWIKPICTRRGRTHHTCRCGRS